jgi:hypothetical protein
MTTYIIGDKGLKREVAWAKKAMVVNYPGIKLIYKGFNLEQIGVGYRLTTLFVNPLNKDILTYQIAI